MYLSFVINNLPNDWSTFHSPHPNCMLTIKFFGDNQVWPGWTVMSYSKTGINISRITIDIPLEDHYLLQQSCKNLFDVKGKDSDFVHMTIEEFNEHFGVTFC